MPAATSASPTGVTLNSPKVAICCSGGSAWLEVRIRSLSRMSGLDPTIVTVPPRMAQKPIGISSLDNGSPVRAEMRLTTGRNRAAAPTFCMKLEMMATVAEMSGMMRRSVRPPCLRIRPATVFMTPVLSRPLPMIITAMIEITALLAKPSNRCWPDTNGYSSPNHAGPASDSRPSRTIMQTAATSTSTTSNTNRKIVSSRIPETQAISALGTLPARCRPMARKTRAPARRLIRRFLVPVSTCAPSGRPGRTAGRQPVPGVVRR
jgi:hypothetical protein